MFRPLIQSEYSLPTQGPLQPEPPLRSFENDVTQIAELHGSRKVLSHMGKLVFKELLQRFWKR